MRWLIACSLLVSATAHAQLKIMPLGDSITQGGFGGGDVNSYRKRLKDSLSTAGITIDFVGPLSHGDGSWSDKEHAGQSGWNTWTFGADPLRLRDYLNTHVPDYVLILLGTNDSNNTADWPIESAINELGRVIRVTLQLRPGCVVLVASIPPLNNGNSTATARAVTYNAEIPQLVAHERARGGDVRYVKVAWTTGDLIDGVHPNNTGYQKLADAFSKAMQHVVSPGPWVINPSVSP